MDNLKYIGVVGSRGLLPNIQDFIDEHNINVEDTVFVSGGCYNSPDECIKKYCVENNIPIQEYLPNWKDYPIKEYGHQAYYFRNARIVLTSDEVYIFYDNKSKGTKMVIELCKKYNKKYFLLKCK